MFKRISLLVALVLAASISLFSQAADEKPSIPRDLLITVKTQAAWVGSSTELTIDAAGNVKFNSSGGLIRVSGSDLFKVKKPLKPHVPRERLLSLLADFEAVQFDQFVEGFPGEEERQGLFLTDMGSETISIRKNGKISEVANYRGYMSIRTRKLIHLAARIRSATVWNYEGGKIPDNFELRYRTTIGGNVILSEIKIDAKGKVSQSFFSSDKRYGGPTLIKTISVGRFSQIQLRNLIDSLDKANFAFFRYSTLGRGDGCTSDPMPGPERRAHIHVQINQNLQMYASLYEFCRPQQYTPAGYFEQADIAVREALAAAGIRI